MYLKKHKAWTLQLEGNRVSYKFLHHCEEREDAPSTVAPVVRVCNRCKACMTDDEWKFFLNYLNFVFPIKTVYGLSKTTYPILNKHDKIRIR